MDKTVQVRLNTDLYLASKELAESRGLNFSALVRTLLISEIKSEVKENETNRHITR